MIPTKTYPLSAIMDNEITDKERIAELEAQLKYTEQHAADLEAEILALRKYADRYRCLRDNCDFAITQNIGHDWINLIFADEVDAAIDAARESK